MGMVSPTLEDTTRRENHMSENSPTRIREALTSLSTEQDEPLATLASGLLSAADIQRLDIDTLGSLEIRETISALAERYRTDGEGAALIAKALVHIDDELVSRGAVSSPWATRLTPLVTARALHATKNQWAEDLERMFAERSPIFITDDRTLVATPTGLSETEFQSRFADRILAEILHQRPRRVILVLSGLDRPVASSPVWDALAEDLAAQKIRLQRILS